MNIQKEMIIEPTLLETPEDIFFNEFHTLFYLYDDTPDEPVPEKIQTDVSTPSAEPAEKLHTDVSNTCETLVEPSEKLHVDVSGTCELTPPVSPHADPVFTSSDSDSSESGLSLVPETMIRFRHYRSSVKNSIHVTEVLWKYGVSLYDHLSTFLEMPADTFTLFYEKEKGRGSFVYLKKKENVKKIITMEKPTVFFVINAT
jgi:hypothetical protein